MCTAGQRVSLTITGPGPSFLLNIDQIPLARSFFSWLFFISYEQFLFKLNLICIDGYRMIDAKSFRAIISFRGPGRTLIKAADDCREN